MGELFSLNRKQSPRLRAQASATGARRQTMAQHHNGSDKAPETIRPANVVFWNMVVLPFGTWAILGVLFAPFSYWSPIWGGLFMLFIIGALVVGGSFSLDVKDWYGTTLFNRFTKKRRAVFPGFHWKLAWETPEEPYRLLKKEISSSGIEQLPTDDPAENMEFDLLILYRVNLHGTAEQAATNFVNFTAVDEHALTEDVRAQVKQAFGEYAGGKEMEQLLKPHEVQDAVVKNPANARMIRDLQEKYGIHMQVVLRSAKPDAATKALKTTPARAEALMAAREKLFGGPHPMDEDKVDDAALLLDPNADYTHAKHDVNVNVKAPDLKNLRDVNFGYVPGGGLGSASKKGGAKGGKK